MSSFAPSAHFLLGEHAFDAKQYAEAATHYEACARGAKDEELAKALYKLAWSLYHTEEFEKAAALRDELRALESLQKRGRPRSVTRIGCNRPSSQARRIVPGLAQLPQLRKT